MPHANDTIIENVMAQLSEKAPSGHVAALHLGFLTPRILLQTFAQDWLDTYVEHSMVLQDPTLVWGMAEKGSCRWSELPDAEDNLVMTKAAEFGLRYGVVFAHADDKTRSIFTATRGDREFTDGEIADMVPLFVQLHELTAGDYVLSMQFAEKLRAKAVDVTQNST